MTRLRFALFIIVALATRTAHATVYSALGASDAVGVGALPPSEGYVPRLTSWLNANYGPWTLRNHGVISYTAVDIRDNTLQAAIDDHPTVVTVWIGADDVTHSVLRGEPTAELQGHFQDAYSTIIQRLRTETSASIVAANIPDVSRLPLVGLVSHSQQQVAHADSLAVNAIIAQVNATYNVPTVDLYDDPASYDSANIFWDGFHPNNHGYPLLAQRFETVLGPLLAAHSLSGQVTNNAGAPLANIAVTVAHNGGAVEVTTNSNGGFLLPGVGFDSTGNGLYTLTPHGGSYNFTPTSRTVDVEGTGSASLNFTGQPTLSLSGTVRGSGPLPNVPVLLLNSTALPGLAAALLQPDLVPVAKGVVARTRTDVSGHYSFTVPPGAYYVLPTVPGTLFSPVLRGPVVVGATSLAGQDFAVTSADRNGPTVLVVNASASRVAGLATDREAGVLTVVATLQNSSNAYLNWQTPNSNLQFTANPVAASFRLATWPGTTTPLLNVSQLSSVPWMVALPRDLPPGTYRFTARAVDRAGHLSLPVSVTVAKSVAAVLVASISGVSASSSTDSVLLRFTSDLDVGSASDPEHYTVTLDGRSVTVESAAYNASAHSVRLALPVRSVRVGDRVAVQWSGLPSAANAGVSGDTTCRAGR